MIIGLCKAKTNFFAHSSPEEVPFEKGKTYCFLSSEMLYGVKLDQTIQYFRKEDFFENFTLIRSDVIRK